MNEYAEGNYPLAYLITIRSYGTWLHGDDKSSVDRHGFNTNGTPRLLPSKSLEDFMQGQMKQSPTLFDKDERICVLDAVREVCDYRGYELLAVNIRSNHLHAVVYANTNPEKNTNEFKAYATRRLRKAGLCEKDKIIWARGKSRRYLWKVRYVEIAVDYVLYGQGEAIPDFS